MIHELLHKPLYIPHHIAWQRNRIFELHNTILACHLEHFNFCSERFLAHFRVCQRLQVYAVLQLRKNRLKKNISLQLSKPKRREHICNPMFRHEATHRTSDRSSTTGRRSKEPRILSPADFDSATSFSQSQIFKMTSSNIPNLKSRFSRP